MQIKKTFLFVHGAWHGSWCWRRVATLLCAQGHHVLTPDLPGHGSKTCLANTIGFVDYVASIIELILQQPIPVTLIGHSMAGLIISKVADMIPNHIHELVYLAAYVAEDQQSLFSIADQSDSNALSPYLIVDPIQQEIRLKSSPELAAIFFNGCDEEDAKKAALQLQPQPLKPFVEQIQIGEQFNRVLKRSFICQHDRVLVMSDQQRMSQTVTDHIVYLEAGHAAYYSNAADIVHELLL